MDLWGRSEPLHLLLLFSPDVAALDKSPFFAFHYHFLCKWHFRYKQRSLLFWCYQSPDVVLEISSTDLIEKFDFS